MQATLTNVVNPRAAAHLCGEDYEITKRDALYQWRGLDNEHGYGGYFSSGAGWQTPEAAQADALYCLNNLDTGDAHSETVALLTSWQFFSPDVLAECDRENAEAFDFSELEGYEVAPLNASQIREELETLAAAGSATPDDYIRLYRAWQAIKAEIPPSYYPVIVDRLNALLTSVVPIEGEAAEIGALARATMRAMNSTDLLLDELKATRQRFSY